MRKLQTTGKAGSRAGTALYGVGKAQPGARTSCAGTFIPFEFQLQQQPQTAIFRSSSIKFRAVSRPGQKQRPKTSAGCGSENASTRESDSVYYASAGHLLPLWSRYKQGLTHRRSCQSAIGSSQRNPAGSARISSPCCDLPSLPGQYYCQYSERVFFASGWLKAGGFHKHFAAKISYERATNSGAAAPAFWLNRANIRRNYRKCRNRHLVCRSFCLSGSSRSDSEGFFNLVRRDRMVPSRNSAMAMGRYFRKPEPVSAFVESQQQSIKTSSWELFRLPDFRSVGKLFYISSSDAPALSESFDSRFSKGSRPGSRGQKTWCLGRQRVEKSDEALESLPPWANFTKAAESVGQTYTQPVQDSGEIRASIERPIYGCSLQKSQEEVGGGLVVRKIPGKSRTNQQSSRKSLAKACNLAKDFTGQQIAQRHDFRSEINDNYDFSCPTGPECNGFSRNYAQKFSSGLSTAKTEFKSRCIKQQKHFAHLTVEKSIFEQSSAYAKIWSCGTATT